MNEGAEAMLQRLVAQYESAFCEPGAAETPRTPVDQGGASQESPQTMAAYAAGYAAGFYTAQQTK